MHLAEVLRREDTSQWEKVDAVKEAVDGDGEDVAAATSLTGGDRGINTGLQSAIAGVWEQVEAIVPEPPEIRTIRGWYTVATFWPAETRVAGASFAAHAEANGADPLALVVSLNVKRRNLTASQRAVAAAEAWDAIEKVEGKRAKYLAALFDCNNAYVSQARALGALLSSKLDRCVATTPTSPKPAP